jgi:hypothetical protein
MFPAHFQAHLASIGLPQVRVISFILRRFGFLSLALL